MVSRKDRIHHILVEELNPRVLEIVNESNRHHVPEGAETHFKVSIVSERFTSQTKIARHRLVNTLLTEELKTGLHALSLHLYTPEEWQDNGGTIPNSPACRGGFRHG